MAIRLRRTGNKNEWVALCAAEHERKMGDVYLDDGQHDALTEKYLEDWKMDELLSTKEEEAS